MGKYTKIFIVNEQQFNDYKQYYDYAVELQNLTQKIENNSSTLFQNRPTFNKETPSYNNYFEPKIVKEKGNRKVEKENLKNNSRSGKEIMESGGRVGQSQVSFSGSNAGKRVSSAKSRQEKKERKVVYDRVSSKKSLKN